VPAFVDANAFGAFVGASVVGAKTNTSSSAPVALEHSSVQESLGHSSVPASSVPASLGHSSLGQRPIHHQRNNNVESLELSRESLPDVVEIVESVSVGGRRTSQVLVVTTAGVRRSVHRWSVLVIAVGVFL
jgi:hypothetical protein